MTSTTSTRPTTPKSIYSIQNTKQYQSYLRDQLDSLKSYNRPITPVYKGSAYNRSHSTVSALGSHNHVLNIPITRVIHNGILRPELEYSLQQYQLQLDLQQKSLQQYTLQCKYNQHQQIRHEFNKLKYRNRLFQYRCGLSTQLPDNAQLNNTIQCIDQRSAPKWKNVTISSKSMIHDNNSSRHLSDSQRHDIISRIDAKHNTVLIDQYNKNVLLQQKQNNIRQLFNKQKYENKQRDQYLEYIFDSDDIDNIQHISYDDILPTTTNTTRTPSRPSSSTRSHTAHCTHSRPLTAEKQSYLNQLSQPSARHSLSTPPIDNYQYYTDPDYNNLVDHNIVQLVSKQRRRSVQHSKNNHMTNNQPHRRTSQQYSVPSYHMSLQPTHQQSNQSDITDDNDLQYNSNTPRIYCRDPISDQPKQVYTDSLTQSISNEIDQFQLKNNML